MHNAYSDLKAMIWRLGKNDLQQKLNLIIPNAMWSDVYAMTLLPSGLFMRLEEWFPNWIKITLILDVFFFHSHNKLFKEVS